MKYFCIIPLNFAVDMKREPRIISPELLEEYVEDFDRSYPDVVPEIPSESTAGYDSDYEETEELTENDSLPDDEDSIVIDLSDLDESELSELEPGSEEDVCEEDVKTESEDDVIGDMAAPEGTLCETLDNVAEIISEDEPVVQEDPNSEIREDNDNRNIEECESYRKLMSMPGLENVKREVRRQIAYQWVVKSRAKEGIVMPARLINMLLLGNPGSGKTTVARLIGKIYHWCGILPQSIFVETNRAQLVGAWIGQTEEGTRECLERAEGGVLFIDEMYSLITDRTDGRDYGRRVVETMMTWLSDARHGTMVIGAGYPDEMRRFLDTNPGLSSRFPTVIDFPDYTRDQLMEIGRMHLGEYGFILPEDTEAKFEKLLEDCSHCKGFGNARTVITIIDSHIVPNVCMRLYEKKSLEESREVKIEVSDLPSLKAVFPLETINKSQRVRTRCLGFH